QNPQMRLATFRKHGDSQIQLLSVYVQGLYSSRETASIGVLQFMIPKTASAEPRPPAIAGPCAKRRVLVVCTHLRPGRIKRRSTYVMQPIAGLHVASLIDRDRYEVTLYHEDWHGPYDTAGRSDRYDIVFLSGLQPDFDRMRQLSFHFRRGGSIVVAGG